MIHELVLELEDSNGIKKHTRPLPGMVATPEHGEIVEVQESGYSEDWIVMEKRISYEPTPTPDKPNPTHCRITLRCKRTPNAANN